MRCRKGKNGKKQEVVSWEKRIRWKENTIYKIKEKKLEEKMFRNVFLKKASDW